MDLKGMLVAAAEAQADKVKDDMMSALNSNILAGLFDKK